jgi:hypothetical protein
MGDRSFIFIKLTHLPPLLGLDVIIDNQPRTYVRGYHITPLRGSLKTPIVFCTSLFFNLCKSA